VDFSRQRNYTVYFTVYFDSFKGILRILLTSKALDLNLPFATSGNNGPAACRDPYFLMLQIVIVIGELRQEI
jgi:hypothetical protein